MGIPKFFRWLSERYPLCSQVVSEHSVPEFDNFYLDMNGIIHVCSRAIATSGHPYTEPEMFSSIFAYVQALVEQVKPKKVLFLAVDGVAPRAKLNQQRSRRFRTAKEAHAEAEKALKKHQKDGFVKAPIANQERFDSNCITPGTEFMQRMSAHLRYFIAQKVAEDVTWRTLQVIFSGPEVPGEGEHKVMEYIRLNKAKPEYDPNVRHCLYGLDADLILLGLLSHDPHFALLREEVVFGRDAQVKKCAADTKFFLLHLCIMREYMEMEFSHIAGHSCSLERLIDDFILMMCLVGNDFLPNIPGFHLGEGVLESIFEAYKRALPHFTDGYLQENGRISFKNLAALLHQLIDYEKSVFALAEPLLCQESTQEKINNKAILLRALFENLLKNSSAKEWRASTSITGGERKLLTDIAQRLELFVSVVGSEVIYSKSREISPDELSQLEEEVLRMEDSPSNRLDNARRQWRRSYYMQKLFFDIDVEQDSLDKLLRDYAEGLQWNMYYYYEGVASWSWFYPYHYAPHISDLANFMTEFVCDPFDLASPLSPLEQLMAVLPPASKALVPASLAFLMTDPSSPIIDFYPTDFVVDANGKKASWEAIIKIPFIDENVLLPALRSQYSKLTAEEVTRNKFGTTVTFEYRKPGRFLASPSTEYPPILDCNAHEVIYELPLLQPNERFVAALCKGARIGIHAMPGFPTLAALPIKGVLDSGIGLDVFGQASKGLSMVLTVNEGGVFPQEQIPTLAERILERRVYVNWPHLREGRVAYISDGCLKYHYDSNGTIHTSTLEPSELDNFSKMGTAIEKEYRKRCAVLIGPVEALIWVCPFIGMTMSADGSKKKRFDETPLPYALQTVIEKRIDSQGMEVEDTRYEESSAADTDISALFPTDSTIVYLGCDSYGSVGTILKDQNENSRLVGVRIKARDNSESPYLARVAKDLLKKRDASFVKAFEVCRIVGISAYLLSKMTSTFTLFLDDGMVRAANIGLDLKSDAKGICAAGLSRRCESWEYSQVVVALLKELKSKFPDVFARLEVEKSNSNVDARKIFPDVTDKDSLLAKIGAFREPIKQSLGKVVKVSISGQFFDKAEISALDSAWQNYTSRSKNCPATIIKTPIENIISPATVARLRSHNQTFFIGERIICLSSGNFGQEGTVVGQSEEKLNILLDNSVIGGTDLDGLVENGRGLVISSLECLNLSNPQPPPGVCKASEKVIEPTRTVTDRPIDKFRGMSPSRGPVPVSRGPVPTPRGPVSTSQDLPTNQQAPLSTPQARPRSIKVEELFGMMRVADQPHSIPAAKEHADHRPLKITTRPMNPSTGQPNANQPAKTATRPVNPSTSQLDANQPANLPTGQPVRITTRPINPSTNQPNSIRPPRHPRGLLGPDLSWKRPE